MSLTITGPSSTTEYAPGASITLTGGGGPPTSYCLMNPPGGGLAPAVLITGQGVVWSVTFNLPTTPGTYTYQVTSATRAPVNVSFTVKAPIGAG